jgi:regulator of protease activity HflC (stomatin/prohibitin superfamily)
MLQTFVVRVNEKGILMRDGDFRRILPPGRHRFLPFLPFGGKATVSTHAQDSVMPADAVVDYLLQNRPAEAEEHFVVMILKENEAGLRFENDILVEVLPPGSRRFIWKGLKQHRLERFDLGAGAELPASAAARFNAANLKVRAVAGLEGVLVAQVLAHLVGVLREDGRVVGLLPPGMKAFWRFNRDLQLSTFAQDAAMPDDDVVDYLLQNQPAEAEEHFIAMILKENEVGLRFENDALVEILPPGARRFIWKGLKQHRLERFDLGAGAELPAHVAARLNAANLKARAVAGLEGVLAAQVPAYHVGVLREDGRVAKLLPPGMKAFWRFNRDIQVELVDTRLQSMEVSGQEILTKDRVGLRLNLVASWRFTDVEAAFAAIGKPVEYLYRELQFGLRAAVGTRSIDAILENKQDIDEMVAAHVKGKLAGFGIEVASLGVRDIVLPGDMKDILARVVEAEKSAEANVIRRREETAATRSLLNTAKVMEDNPVALRLKELETLERVAERIDRISVFGGLDQVLNGLVTLKT